jgi:small GTP-binding protein
MVLEGTGPVDLFIWDTAGQEQFHSLVPLYSRSASLVIIAASLDDESSFSAISEWIETATSSCTDDPPPMVLAVNKIDQKQSAVLNRDDVEEEYQGKFLGLFFVSALTGENIEHLFNFVAIEAIKYALQRESMRPKSGQLSENGDKSCC